MSSEYDSESQSGSQDNNNKQYSFKVFQQDFYLSASLDNIQQWKDVISNSFAKQSTQIDPIKYIQNQVHIFEKQQNFLRAAYHIRYYAFAFYLNKSLTFMESQYKKAYQKQKFSRQSIQKLDETIIKISFCIQKIELTRAANYIQQIDSQIMGEIYQRLQLIFPMMLQPYCIWRIVMFLQIMRSGQNFYVMNIPFNMPLEYYQKTFKTLKFRNQLLTKTSLSIQPLLQQKKYLQSFAQALKILYTQQSKNIENKQQQKNINEQVKCEFICCLKYMFFVTGQEFKTQNNLYMEYIMASLKVPYYGRNQNMPTQYYQELFMKVLKQFKNNPKLIELGLYIDPNIVGERSKQSFGKLEELVLSLCKQLTDCQQVFLSNNIHPKEQYIKQLLAPQQFTLLIQFLQTIMEFNKSSFLKADNQIYEVFLQMAQFLKNVFLSFGRDLWLFPQNIFTPLTLGFFKKISEDINDDLKNLLYRMVENLNHNKLPKKLVFENNQFKLEQVTRSQYLCAILYYIDDCSKQEEYLNLPQIAPADFQSSVLLVKSLHVKLKHHQPNPAQLPLFTQYLRQCQKYKLHINFVWYKQQSFLSKSFQRELQFQIQSGLPLKQIRQLYRKSLNYRDRQYVRILIQQTYNKKHQLNPVQIASMIKYNHGIENLPEINNVRQTQIFLLLQQMNTMLSILPNDLFDLPLEQEINVSYLHLLLTFYCSEIKAAKGSQIYLGIFQKILLNYLRYPSKTSAIFREKYPKFFQKFIYQYHQIDICATLNELLIQFQDKYIPFSKNQNQWSAQQKLAVSDLKLKIQSIRDQFLDKLEGSQQEIAMFMVTFTSLISEVLPFTIYLQCVQLFVKLINRKPALEEVASLNAFMSLQIYKQPKFFQNILSYFQNYLTQDSHEKRQVKIRLLKHLLKSGEILDIIKFKQLMQLLGYSIKHLGVDQYINQLEGLYQTMNNVAFKTPQKIHPSWFLAFILIFYKKQFQSNNDFEMFQQQTENKGKLKVQKIKSLLDLINNLQNNKQFWEQCRANLKDFKIKDSITLFSFHDEIKQSFKKEGEQTSFKQIWLKFLKCLSDPSWTFYYIIRFQQPSLINIHENRDEVLINLIKKEKLTKQSYPIFKNMISQTKNMQFILQKIFEKYEQEQNYVQNYQFHNKLILINERFPDPKIQNCIINWIKIGQNKFPLKIPQNYYINFIKNQLKKLPDNLGNESILKIHEQGPKLKKLNKEIQNVFQLLLYFPIKRYQSINLSTITQQKSRKKSQQKMNQDVQNNDQIEDDQDQWQQEDDQNDQKQKEKKSEQAKKNKKNKDLDNEQQNENQQQEDSSNEQNSDNEDNNNYYEQRPQILQIFYEEGKEAHLKQYKQFYRLREEIDVYLKSDYDKLINSPIQDNQYLFEKLQRMVKSIMFFDQSIQRTIVTYLPIPLYQYLRKRGITAQRNTQKLQKLRKPKKKLFKIRQEFFSDRAQSDGSQDTSENYSSDDSYEDQEDEQDDQHLFQNNYQQDEYQQQSYVQKKKIKPSKNKKQQQEQQIQLPSLNTQFSKIQSEIKGNQLQKRQIIKILQIFLVQMFKLTPINFRKKQIVHSYLEIMESDFGQVFFQSVLTLLRIDQNPNKNRKILVQSLKINNKTQKIQEILGLAQFSKYNGIVNLTHLLKSMKEDDKYPHGKNNPFHKESGSILPIAEKFIVQFDLPLQKNIFSLVLIYIQSKKKIRDLIEEITVGYEDDGQQMSKKQIKRICQALIRQKSHISVWEYIQQMINYRVSDTDQLIISLENYSKQVFKSLSSSALRVKQTIQNNSNMGVNKMKEPSDLKSNNVNQLKHYQRLYYIISNLLNSCSQEIKQFYHMNKHICRYLWEDDDQNSDTYNYKKIPKKLLKSKNQIYTNQAFILLTQLSLRIIYYVKKQFYGKISSKKFSRLIHFPKLIIQTATLYMHISSQRGTKDKWEFQSKSQAQQMINKYQMGHYQFKNLTQVYSLIIGLLDLQSFCTGKFKQLLIPYFIKNRKIGLQTSLLFKIPQIDQDVNGQNIYVTRQCSFDMAFYQVNSQGIYVEFHGQEGSDHGGLVRQFMMGWKGVGVGQQDFFLGKIIGISFRQSVPYGGYVDLQMCIKITQTKITMENIQQIDKEIYKSLRFVIDNDPADLDLTFSVMKKNPKSFEIQEFNLKPNGNQINVTQQNKQQYIKLYLQKYYELGREKQLQEIATGFYTVVLPEYAAIFKPHQLMQHVKGQQVCDVNVLKNYVRYIEGYTQTSLIIKWFWQILQSFNQQQLNKFIQFLTGSPKLPIFNPNYQIIIEKVYEIKNLPVAHTCFNTLDLPEYPTKDILEKNLITAIFEGNDNFGIM